MGRVLRVAVLAGCLWGTSATAANRCKKSIMENLVFRGTPDDKRVMGFHGTSFAALKVASVSGVLATGYGPGNEGYIYFYPNGDNPQLQKASKKLFGMEFDELPANFVRRVPGKKSARVAFDEAATYSHVHASIEFFAKKLGLTDIALAQRLHSEALDFAQAGAEPVRLLARGLSKREITKLALDSDMTLNPEEGISFVLSFDPKILKDFKVETAGGTDEGMRIYAPDGIPLRYVSGIEVVSKFGSKAYKSFDEWLASLRTPSPQ